MDDPKKLDMVTPRAGFDPSTLELLGRTKFAERILPSNVFQPASGTSGEDVPGVTEPVIDFAERCEIQGNVIPGFNKDHQHFLFLRFGPLSGTKRWIRWIAPYVSSMDEVIAFVRMHRSLRRRLGLKEPGLAATWVNIAFSSQGLATLLGKRAVAAFGEQSFRQDLAARSTYLGDPARPTQRGHASRWLVGGPDNTADVVVIVAADRPGDLAHRVAKIKARAAVHGLDLIFEQRGETLPDPLRGHEHFGFKDGVSQPGVRGKMSTAPGDYVTPRYIASTDRHAQLFAKPGQPVLWPGQFVLGMQRQSPDTFITPAPVATNFPSWARLGSFLVVRRLRQDVPAFWHFVKTVADATGVPSVHAASMLVGRWPSGAPIMRARTGDDPALAGDDFANNSFIFDDDTTNPALRPIPGYAGDSFPTATQDVLGAVCPHFAHIRKVNPRDTATDLGKPSDSLIRMILRRGIPFGPPLVGVDRPSAKLVRRERGLMFLSYGATIEDQFEFLSRRWANSPVQPNFGGHDPVIGQRDQYGDRSRQIDFPAPAGTVRVRLDRDFVVPTGGGYFFAPPIGALTSVLGA